VALGLIIGELIKEQGIKPDVHRVQAALEHLAGGYEHPQQVIAHYRSNREQMDKVEAMILEDQLVDWVLEQADVNDQQMTFDELIKLGVSENPS
jgi:trigger factor